MKKILPEYFLKKYQLIGTVTFTAFFSIVFLLVSFPFSNNVWFTLQISDAFAFTVAFYAISLLIVIFSKVLLYRLRLGGKMTYFQYVLWCLTEVTAISLLYAFFTVQGSRQGFFPNATGEISFGKIFFSAMVYSTISVVIPYIIAGMYFTIIEKNATIRLLNYSTAVSDEVIAPRDEQKITLFDNSGVMRLSVRPDNLYYIESDDNYIKVWYTDSGDKLTTYMLRCRLRTVEESFAGSSLVRCHRKYVVNLNRVRVLRKEKDGYELELDNNAIPPIPITKTYSANVLARFRAKEAGEQKEA